MPPPCSADLKNRFPGSRFRGPGFLRPPFFRAAHSPPPFFAAAVLLRAFLIRRGAYAPHTLSAPKIPQAEFVQFLHILARGARSPVERFSVRVVSLPSRKAQNAERLSVSSVGGNLNIFPLCRAETETATEKETEKQGQNGGNSAATRFHRHSVRNRPPLSAPVRAVRMNRNVLRKRNRKLRIMRGNFTCRTEITLCTENQNRARAPKNKQSETMAAVSLSYLIYHIRTTSMRCRLMLLHITYL